MVALSVPPLLEHLRNFVGDVRCRPLTVAHEEKRPTIFMRVCKCERKLANADLVKRPPCTL